MLSLSGNYVDTLNSYEETRRSYYAVRPIDWIRIPKWQDYIRRNRIGSNNSGTLVLDPEETERQVITAVSEKGYLFPLFVNEVKQRFESIPEVRYVEVREYDHEKKYAYFAISVYMPMYDYDLMKKLASLEVSTIKEAGNQGLKLDYDYVPLP